MKIIVAITYVLISNIYIVTVSITDERYTVMDTVRVLVECMNSEQFSYGYYKVDFILWILNDIGISSTSSFNSTKMESNLMYITFCILSNTSITYFSPLIFCFINFHFDVLLYRVVLIIKLCKVNKIKLVHVLR